MLLGVEWNRKIILKFKMAVKCADAMIITLFFYYFSVIFCMHCNGNYKKGVWKYWVFGQKLKFSYLI